ncbi:MAG TPA: hypothetical protein VM324_03945 [Egibacteraceae bacterium]|jgi:hypothetical protein|nr:hypothetical protein [Egibacteraceae bacterium]
MDVAADPVRRPPRGGTFSDARSAAAAGRRRAVVAVALLAAYVAQLAVAATRHEPWFDEAQAWLLARDSGVWELLTQRLRYEGTPGLWHLLLVVPARLGLPYATAHLIALVAATLAAVLLVRSSPFPRWLVGLLLFSFVLGYQYAVVARSYVLVAPLLFALAAIYPRKATAVWPFVGLLALLANVSAHGTLIAACIAAVHLLDVVRSRNALSRRALAHHAAALASLAVAGLLVVAQLWVPDDHLPRAGYVPPGGADLVAVMATTANRALADHGLLTWAAIVVSAWWFARRGTLLVWLLPTVGLLAFFARVYQSAWHDGLLVLVWVFALWVSFTAAPMAGRLDRGLRTALLAVTAAVLAVQVTWWAQTWYHDVTQPYSGSPALAAYLDELDLDRRVVWGREFHSLGVLPYFPANIYDNLHGGDARAYLSWQRPYPLVDDDEAIREALPDLVVWGVKFPGHEHVTVLDTYDVEAFFPGEIFYKDRVLEQDAFYLLRRKDPGQGAGR